MPRPAHPLSNKAIADTIKGVGKRHFPLFDGHGLHLIARDGHYHWRLKYHRPDGRENRLALGAYPDVSLAEARTMAETARAKLRQGIDPARERQAAKATAKAASDAVDARMFTAVAERWLALKDPGWSAVTRRKNAYAVRHYLLPDLGTRDAAALRTADVLPVIAATNVQSPEFARTAAGAVQNIVRLAIAEGIREEGRLLDLDLRHNLPRHERGHMAAATTVKALTAVVQAIAGIKSPVTRGALWMCCYTAQRPINVVSMRWDALDIGAAEWNLPAKVMKTRRPHVVPLPRQALAILADLRPLTGGVGYVFPPLARQRNEHLTRDALSSALRDAGLQGKQTPHGLRATFRTVARERLGVASDILEAQLAHAKRGQVQAAYDRTGFLQERHKVMQRWADYLDAL
ncbi:MAG TPA: integrase arm-type DNA-binding domain-containing protein [Rhodanobacteraceae bacterium]